MEYSSGYMTFTNTQVCVGLVLVVLHYANGYRPNPLHWLNIFHWKLHRLFMVFPCLNSCMSNWGNCKSKHGNFNSMCLWPCWQPSYTGIIRREVTFSKPWSPRLCKDDEIFKLRPYNLPQYVTCTTKVCVGIFFIYFSKKKSLIEILAHAVCVFADIQCI